MMIETGDDGSLVISYVCDERSLKQVIDGY
jgi:hypothetical protein